MADFAAGAIDVAVIGGSFAGLTAALQLGRASRQTAVIDAGAPRNRVSPAAHGVPGSDGTPPGEILERYRADLAAYPTVRLCHARAERVTGVSDAFTVELEDGEAINARRIVLAHGVTDLLPDIPGLAENWGRTVLHCPYCHGYEVRGRPLAVLATHPMSAHQAGLLRADWSDDVTLVTGGMEGVDTDALAVARIGLETCALKAVHADGDGLTLELTDGTTRTAAALFLGPRVSLAGTLADRLGCALAEGPMGDFVLVGPMKQTSIAGVFAAGDLAGPMPNVNIAVADGTLAGIGSHQSLVFPGFIEPVMKDTAA